MKPHPDADATLELEEEIDGYRLQVWLNRTSKTLAWRCGYLLLPKGHTLEGLDYDDPRIEDLIVHGGVTYVDREDDRWELGFDCAHCGDMTYLDRKGHYWITEEVREELLGLLEQVRLDINWFKLFWQIICRWFRRSRP